MISKLECLIETAKAGNKKTLVVAGAENKNVLESVQCAVKMGIIKAILVGDKDKINKIFMTDNIKDICIVDEVESENIAENAVNLVASGKGDFLMKGNIGTAALLKAFLRKEVKLKGKELLSHVAIFEVKSYHKLIFLTDGAMVTYPDIIQKIGLIKNAVNVANTLGVVNPKVAVLCALENVNTSMQCTIDAALLTQMNRRGQITGCIVDGPLALDNSISKESAIHKGIKSDVAGDSDILLVPNIESGNFLGKALTYFAGAESAGVIVGGKSPIVLNSRSDSMKSKLYSIALGVALI